MRARRLSAANIDASTPDREVLTELIGLHARSMQRMPWVQAWLVVGIALFIHSAVSPLILGGWALLTIGIEIGRARYAQGILARGYGIDPKRVHLEFVLLAGLSGAAITTGAVIFLPKLPILHQALFGAVLFAIPAAGAIVSQSSPYILGAYAFSILIPATVTWDFLHPSQALGLSIMTTLYCVVITLVSADGEKLLLRSVAIRHERDQLIQDLERKNAEVQVAVAKAEAAALARARVLAAASHDLRQPLHALSVYSAVLTAQPDPAVLAEVGGHIVEMVRSLGSVLNGLLDLSRLSSGYYVPERRQIALDRTLAPVCAEFMAVAAAKGLDLRIDLQPVTVETDPVAMARIARNLIDNAVKYTDRGSVQITTRMVDCGPDGPRALLTVTDTGRGIGEEDQQRIFEEFYQVGNPGRDRSQGVGLGLAIVQRLGELLDARISLISRLGEGSTFEMALPAIPMVLTQSVPARSAETRQEDIRGKRVYVVDDELDVLRGTQTLLEMWNLEVHSAGSQEAAEQLCARNGPPDLMIADLRLGAGEHGAQLAARLHRQFGFFPVLIVSGETSSAALAEANRQSFPLLHKPATPESYRAAVTLALQGAAAPDARV